MATRILFFTFNLIIYPKEPLNSDSGHGDSRNDDEENDVECQELGKGHFPQKLRQTAQPFRLDFAYQTEGPEQNCIECGEESHSKGRVQ